MFVILRRPREELDILSDGEADIPDPTVPAFDGRLRTEAQPDGLSNDAPDGLSTDVPDGLWTASAVPAESKVEASVPTDGRRSTDGRFRRSSAFLGSLL